MKKIFSFAIIGMLAFTAVSCDRNNDNVQVENTDTYSRVYDVNANMIKSATDNSLYGFNGSLPVVLFDSDVILIYRQSGVSNGNPIWQILPTADFLAQGELNYKFDFTKNDFQIFADADFDLFAQSTAFKNQYLNNQKFRVVLVPADFGKSVNGKDYNDYYDVIKRFNIDDSKVKNL